ncbi:ankyrin repeat-containing domain protein, partial [Paecilomyces variotii]
LFLAADYGHTSIVGCLIDVGLDVNDQDDRGNTAIFHSARSGKTDTMKILLENGADVHHRNPTFVTRNAQSALHGAVLKNATELVELLLQQEINIDARDKHGRTPLFYAVQRCRTPIVQMLLEAGADSNISEDDFTEPILPINWAAARGFEAIVKMLLDSGANANQLDHPSQSPLLWALGVYNHDFSKKLYRGRSPLRGNHFAFGDAEAVLDLLLKNGADPNVIDEDGRTPLYLSVKLGLNSKALVRSFLRAGCDPNRKDKYGRTPLMGATVRGMTKFVTALLEAPNLDRDATDNFGRTALLEATARNKPLIRDILLQPSAETQMAHPSTSLDEQISYPGHLCGICGVHEWRDLAYHCSICDEGHFDMCEECKKWGATCLDATHEMTRRFDIVGGRASDIGIYILSEAELAELGGARKAQEKPDRMSAYRQAPKFFQ